MSKTPSDGLGDGTQSSPFSIDVDVTTLSHYEAANYRLELLNAIAHPGIEFDVSGDQGKIDLEAYQAKANELKTYLDSFAQ